MVRGLSTMGIAGPALVKAATGEDIDGMALGGADIQVDRQGYRDLGVASEDEALGAAARRFLVPPAVERTRRAADCRSSPAHSPIDGRCSTWCRCRRARPTTCARCYR